MGEEQPDSGTVERGHLVRFGYYDQHLKSLPEDATVVRAVWPQENPAVEEQQMRDLLGRFGLSGEQAYQRVGDLSGGERSRAALARLVALEVNVLVLDEPTNHLDLWACDALEEGLLAFGGTVIVVSHDRYFLNRVVDLLVVLGGDGRCEVIHGNYDTYERMHALEGGRCGARTPDQIEEPAPSPATPRRRRRQSVDGAFPYRKVEEIEADIAEREAELRELEQQMASPDLYRDGSRVKETKQAFDTTKARLEELYEHWEEASELN